MLCAYFLTWTTYGTWLHGDPRGSVDDFGRVRPDAKRREKAAARMVETAFVMVETDRATVAEAIARVCTVRGWTSLACNVRTNHVHLVVKAPDVTPEHAAELFKSWATRALKASGRHPGRTRFWTNQSSTPRVEGEEAIARAVEYTRSQ